MQQKRLNFVSWYRATGVIFILLCHFCQKSNNAYFNMAAQFFNIGNDMFFIMSGFLFGIHGGIGDSVISWYKKRLKRIYIPYELMVCVLFVVTLATKTQLSTNWFSQILGVQGWNGVYGAAQTWFITSILICYLLTPIISSSVSEFKKSDRNILSLLVTLLLLPIVMVYTFDGICEVSLIVPVCWYSIAYIIGMHYENVKLNNRYMFIAIITFLVCCVLRIIGKHYLDETVFYTKVLSNYTHFISAVCMFYVFAYIFRNKQPIKIVKFVDLISFEIYLWHYMFTDGPLLVFGKTWNWITDCITVFIITLIIAYIANLISRKIDEGISSKKCKSKIP